MFKITIKKYNVVTNEATFNTQEEATAWVADCEAQKAFGQPAWVEEIEAIEDKPAYQIVHPAEYEITVEDMTAQIAAEQAQLEAVQAAQQNAAIRLMTFPSEVDNCQDLEALKAAIKIMISDIAILLTKKG